MTIRMKIMMALVIMGVIGLALGIVGLVTTNNLTSMSGDLHTMQKESSSASRILSAHYVWRHGLTAAVFTGSDFTGSLDPNSCALGNWFTSEEAQNITDPEVLSLLNQVKAPHDFIHMEARSVVEYIENGDFATAGQELVDVILPRTQEVISLLTDVTNRYSELIEEKSIEIETLGAFMTVVIIVLLLAAAVSCVILSILITRSIVKPLIPLVAFMTKAGTTGDIALTPDDMAIIGQFAQINDEIGRTITASASFVKHVTDVAEELDKISSGDISVETNVLSDKDVLGTSIQRMLASLNDMFSEINSSSAQVSIGAGEVAHGSQSLAQGSTEQAASVQQLSASITDISGKTIENAKMANQASEMSQEIRVHSEKEVEQMNQLMKAVQEITDASNAISGVIKVIDDIAFQTNILALNAAVEAARAGQHGKGFAVVAEEVRNLAAKSAESAKNTGSLIENSIQKANLGLSLAKGTAESLKEVVDVINRSTEIIIKIASSSEEQATAIAQVNIGVDQVSQVIQQNSATAEQSAAASEEMSSQATVLQELVKRFKLRDDNTTYRLGS